ncbi:hypothetical protein F4778DRAFT_712960 [Xylariomycetidae sp. FL2044]|nr:hypothetical protein F4778DRAFT_712960 [Xylariomycetidae sp. FL2044]
MRLARLTRRHVKSLPLPIASATEPRPRCSPQLLPPAIEIRDANFRRNARNYSVSLVGGTDEAAALLTSELSEEPRKLERRRQKPLSLTTSLVQESELFSKWTALLTDSYRLSVESDFFRQGPAKQYYSRLLVDKWANYGDLALWAVLLDYQKRINGDAGVFNVWQGLWGRKVLYDVDSPLAPMFWRVILEAAVNWADDKFLNSVWIYSEWMLATHDARWPNFYNIVISHFLHTSQHRRALQWQLRLTPNFYPGAREFSAIIRRFANNPDPRRFRTLKSLYIANTDHKLYDAIVPYLYSQGLSSLAKRWRDICVLYDDLPMERVPARSFLRFLKGYFPDKRLSPEEEAALGDLNFNLENDTNTPSITSENVNRAYGNTFGISVKNYNDKLGARWFASSWVSLDTAISTVATLGIEEIGPLSLQSIALRESKPEDVLKRLSQLREHGISVTDSNYLKLVLYFAEMKDPDLLRDLLHSDLHPDVFDDLILLTRLVESSPQADNWQSHRLLLAARIIITKRMARTAANSLLQAHFDQRYLNGTLAVLDDMRTMDIEINETETRYIFDTIDEGSKPHNVKRGDLAFYIAVCRKLVSMEIPVPARCWQAILYCLTFEHKLSDLERLSFDIIRMCTSYESSRPGFFPVHPDDVPDAMRKPLSGVENLLGIFVPLDLPRTNTQHPLRKMISMRLIRTMVRYSFTSFFRRPHRSNKFESPSLLNPMDFHFAHAMRLLRLLHGQGLPVDPVQLQRFIMDRLSKIYMPGTPLKKEWQLMKAYNNLSLPEIKAVIDEAWGEELLPPLDDMRLEIELRGQKLKAQATRQLASRGKTWVELEPRYHR